MSSNLRSTVFDAGPSDRDWREHPVPENDRHSEVVVRAVAAETGQDPARMTPIFDVVDPESIDRLFESGPSDEPRSLTCEFQGCRVVVERDRVSVGVTRSSR